MKLKAKHTIYRAEGKKQVKHEPGAEFSCSEAEAEEYLSRGAAVVIEGAPKKKVAAKAETVVEPSAVKGAEGKSGDDDEKTSSDDLM